MQVYAAFSGLVNGSAVHSLQLFSALFCSADVSVSDRQTCSLLAGIPPPGKADGVATVATVMAGQRKGDSSVAFPSWGGMKGGGRRYRTSQVSRANRAAFMTHLQTDTDQSPLCRGRAFVTSHYCSRPKRKLRQDSSRSANTGTTLGSGTG